jgi:hypothetical protein
MEWPETSTAVRDPHNSQRPTAAGSSVHAGDRGRGTIQDPSPPAPYLFERGGSYPASLREGVCQDQKASISNTQERQNGTFQDHQVRRQNRRKKDMEGTLQKPSWVPAGTHSSSPPCVHSRTTGNTMPSSWAGPRWICPIGSHRAHTLQVRRVCGSFLNDVDFASQTAGVLC